MSPPVSGGLLGAFALGIFNKLQATQSTAIAIGSYIVEELQKEPAKEIAIYDNFTRGTRENIKNSHHDDLLN